MIALIILGGEGGRYMLVSRCIQGTFMIAHYQFPKEHYSGGVREWGGRWVYELFEKAAEHFFLVPFSSKNTRLYLIFMVAYAYLDMSVLIYLTWTKLW